MKIAKNIILAYPLAALMGFSLCMQVADMACERTKIMKWLLGRVRQREFDSVKQYASEVLAILVQNSTGNRKRLVDANGIDILLQVCSHPSPGV